ncbi:hypothetical protein WN943_005874 [Citrus x changshan-huyou]
MRLIPSIHVVPNQLHGSLKKETLTPAHGMVSSAMKTKVVSSRLTSRVAASRVLSTLAAAFSRLSILSGLIFLLTTSMPDKSVFFDSFITLRLRIARKNSIFTWYLSSNKLSGELPTSIGYLDSSKELDISMNELSGQFPTSIRNLASLEEPQLPFSRFSRELPCTYDYSSTISNKGQMMSYGKILNILSDISLSSNRFDGEIPTSVSNLRGLQILSLANSSLHGHIPSCLGKPTDLESLDLSDNYLSDKIPQQLG